MTKRAKVKTGKRGRRNNYELLVKPRLKEIRWWRRDGILEDEIVKRLGVSLSSFQDYKNKYSELLDAIKKGRQHCNYVVEDSLFKRAIGYEYEETKTIFDPSGAGKNQPTITKIEKTKKFIPPDVTAQIFYLKNCWKEKYKDRQDVHHSGEMNLRNTVNLSGMSDDQLKNAIKGLENEKSQDN